MNQAEMANCQANLDSFSDLCKECGHRYRFQIGRVFVCVHRLEQLKAISGFSENPLDAMATTIIVEDPE